MHVGILFSWQDPSEHVTLHESDDAEPFLAPYIPDSQLDYIAVRYGDFDSTMESVSNKKFDVVVNLCDGGLDEPIPGIEVVRYLENAKIPFTGATSAFFDPTRQEMSDAATRAGVATPGAIALHAMTEMKDPAFASLTYPLIVKHPRGYGSVGLTRASRVVDSNSLAVQAERMINAFGGALVEEFIEGREFTVLVAEPRLGEDIPWVFTPHEVGFPTGETFKHYDLKWKDYAEMSLYPVEDQTLSKRLRLASIGIFQQLSGTGYARLDFRLNALSVLFFLEINPNCSIFMPTPESYSSADTILISDGSLPAFVHHILERARTRTIG